VIPVGRKRQLNIVVVVTVAVTALIFTGVRTTRSASSSTPPYYREAPERLPVVLDSRLFSDAETRVSYKAAATNAALFSQLPCSCHCERTHGHKSLLSCFTDAHGTECSICRREALFAASEARRGKHAADIRSEIIQGLWSRSDAEVNDEQHTLAHP
jgi:hypothetical protein